MTLLAASVALPAAWRCESGSENGDSASASEAPTRTVMHASTHKVSEHVRARVTVQCDAVARVSGTFYRFAPGTQLRFGAYSVRLVGTGTGHDQVLFDELGMIHRPPSSRTPVVSVTRLSTVDLGHFSEECGVRDEADLVVSIEPAAGLSWSEVARRDQVVVSARLDPLR